MCLHPGQPKGSCTAAESVPPGVHIWSLDSSDLRGEECEYYSPSLPELLPRGDRLEGTTATRWGKWWQKKTMASGEAGVVEPSKPPTKAAEYSLETSSVLLAVRECFPSEISLFFCVESRSSQCLNSQLQEAAKKKLWALQSDDRSVCALFKELSARLVCMKAQENCFILTFKTLEEVWKFSTYLTLGYVGSCLEQLLFDHEYWLDCALMEDTKITVTVDEDRLASIYVGLLLQEGNFFSRAAASVCQKQEGEEDLQLCRNELIYVKNIGKESKWEGVSLLTNQRGLVPVTALEQVLHPFYQWFLKNYAVSFGISQEISGMNSQPIVKGRCIATEDYRGAAGDELSFCKGDSIEVIGFFIPGLTWFVGKSLSSGNIGFVPARYISLEACEPLGKSLVFLSEEEKSPLLRILCNGGEQRFTTLLSDLARTDITSVYRLDGFEPTAVFLKVPSKAVLCDCKDIQLLQSWEEINGLATTSTSELSSPESESDPAMVKDIFLEKLNDFDDPKFFIDLNAGYMEDADVFDPILTFLNQDSYVTSFQSLYDHRFSFHNSTFGGFSDEDELVLYLETSRNRAKRTHAVWAHVRLCFLLGKLCIKKVKLSQARVYFEEAMSILDRSFGDLPLLAALHVNLASIYLKQNMKSKFSPLLGKTVALLVCLPDRSFSSANELEFMMYVLREAIAVGNTPLEARVCFLIVNLFLQLGKTDEVLPFTEHLQCLTTTILSPDTSSVPLDATPVLSYLYDRKYLPNIALASARSFVPSNIKEAPTPIWRAGFILQNASKLLGSQLEKSDIPALACYYLKQALHFSCETRAASAQRTLCTILSRMYLQHGVLDGAVCYAAMAVTLSRLMGEEEAFESSLSLGWMYLLNDQPGPAANIMWQLLRSLHGTESMTQAGAVHNLLAIALKGDGQVQTAAKNYLQALHKARETGNKRNQAIALANLGQLSLSQGANQLSELYLLQSTQQYAELQGSEDLEMELVWVLLWLAQAMVNRQKVEDAKLCYELALFFALKWHNVTSQLHVTESLCHFYHKVSPNLQACITYHEHWVSLAQQLQDREMEGDVLQTLSQLYQALGTSEALRHSLDCTKQSLRIFIDLEETVKAAEAWLQAGRLYYLMQEDELVEMYFQAAIQTALKSKNFSLAMDLYEKAGDTFFNGSRNRDRAVEFLREGAVPLARKLKATKTELRLFNKLAELQIGLRGYEKALEFAMLAARLSVRVGDQLQKLVAFHRLATVYYLLHMYEMAEECYLKALAMCPPLLQCSGEALYYCKVYCHLGNLALHKLKDGQDAAVFFLLALAAAIELGNKDLQDLIRAKLWDIPIAV